MNQQENKAGIELIVSKLTVLEGISGGGIEEIKQDVEMIQSSVQTMGGRQNDYWSALSKDGVITPVEKRQLKKEYGTIDATHTALMAQAREKGIETSKEVWAYDTAFEDLHDYLFIQLKLFDNMAENTELDSSETFNGYYNVYYTALQNAQAKVNIGDPGKIRKLNSLQDLGNDGEVALFEDNFYYYDLANHEWIGISVASKLGEYMGVLTESPPQVLNQYFLVGPEGIYTDWLEITGNARAAEENAWVDEYGEIIYINMGFETGYIYYWSENNEFVKVEDKNNWRYIVAMNDMIACHYDISPQLYEWLTGELAEELSKDVEEKVLEHSPKNLGQASTVPLNPNDGDWMVWAAASTSRFTKGHVYVYEKETVSWRELNPSDLTGKVRDMFMSSLTDILQVNPTESGYFSYIFAQAFFSNSATINSLRTYQAVIEEGGYIKSDNFVSGQSGWILNDKGAQLNSIVILDYATSEELSAVDGKADSAQTAADTAQGTADDAATAAGTAQTTANSASNAALFAKVEAETASVDATMARLEASNIRNGITSLDKLHGTILRDLSDPTGWAIKTENFDPLTSESGFGITKKGNLYANDGIFRGTVYATDGSFSGELNCGSLQVKMQELETLLEYYPKNKGIEEWSVVLYLYNTILHGEPLPNEWVILPNEIKVMYGDIRIDQVVFEQAIDPGGHPIYPSRMAAYDSTGSFIKYFQYAYLTVDVRITRHLGEKLLMLASELPTELPDVKGIVWNDNGVLKVS
ncbi:hypothetical protein [Treponema sp.]|uniref:hypothetical protein n=1 Tax=Treponema sp. TaxID=166 RepID=UPI00298E6BDC|nr:hypothetical protein [Treponema sp.]MCQ2242089.1 hypothetical protein [Treponema sp.]